MRVPENFLLFLSAHRDCSEKLVALADGLTADEIEISVDAKALRLKRMVKDVMAEAHRLKGFVRLKPLGPRILYGYLRPRHRIGWLISDHFALRNPEMIVVLGNGCESWVSLSSGGRIMHHHGHSMPEVLEKLKTAFSGSDDEDLEGIWRIYYESQCSLKRRNPEAFHRRMPERDLKSCGSTTARDGNCTRLDDFFG